MNWEKRLRLYLLSGGVVNPTKHVQICKGVSRHPKSVRPTTTQTEVWVPWVLSTRGTPLVHLFIHSFTQSLVYLPTYLPVSLPPCLPPPDPSVYLPTFCLPPPSLPVHLFTYLPSSRPVCLPTHPLSTSLLTYLLPHLATCVPVFLSTFLPSPGCSFPTLSQRLRLCPAVSQVWESWV